MNKNSRLKQMILAAALTLASLSPSAAWAHCDSLEGPVIRDARVALDQQDVQLILRWVGADDEDAVRAAFEHTLEVRTLSDAARDLADTYFFETLVRIHRAGEGAPYTGLKPAGAPLDPGIAAADAAVESSQVGDLMRHLGHALGDGIRTRFEKLNEARVHADDSVSAGRAYVAAYVEFIHYVEGVVAAVEGQGLHHAPDTPHGPAGHEGAAHDTHDRLDNHDTAGTGATAISEG